MKKVLPRKVFLHCAWFPSHTYQTKNKNYSKKLEPSTASIYRNYKELINLVVGFILTAVVGSFIAYKFQEKSHLENKRIHMLENEKSSATVALQEVSEVLDARHFYSLQMLDALHSLQDNDLPEHRARVEKSSIDYRASVEKWNIKWNFNRAMINRSFGVTIASSFYSQERDELGTWQDFSITGKLRTLHRQLVLAKNAILLGDDFDLTHAKNIYHLLGYDIYSFYNSTTNRLHSGELGVFLPQSELSGNMPG